MWCLSSAAREVQVSALPAYVVSSTKNNPSYSDQHPLIITKQLLRSLQQSPQGKPPTSLLGTTHTIHQHPAAAAAAAATSSAHRQRPPSLPPPPRPPHHPPPFQIPPPRISPQPHPIPNPPALQQPQRPSRRPQHRLRHHRLRPPRPRKRPRLRLLFGKFLHEKGHAALVQGSRTASGSCCIEKSEDGSE